MHRQIYTYTTTPLQIQEPTIMNEFNSLHEDILAELECPICTEYMIPPIRQCETGHNICEPCMKKLPRCSLCQMSFTNTKNISLQALAYKVYYRCTNESAGCPAKFKLDQRENHERNCSFRNFKCIWSNCTWIGQLKEICDHWRNVHHQTCNEGVITQSFATYDKTGIYMSLLQVHGQLFWIKQLVKSGKLFIWTVQLIGRPDEASQYIYKVTVSESDSKREINLKDYCKSIDIDENDLFTKDIYITKLNTDHLPLGKWEWCLQIKENR